MKNFSNEQLVLMLKSIRDLQDQIKILEEEVTCIQDEVKGYMSDIGVDRIDTGIYKVSWKPYTQSRFDTTKFKGDHEALYKAYTKTVETRRFVIS